MCLIWDALWERYDVVWLCGARVQEAFGVGHLRLWDVAEYGGGKQAFVAPHPSGLSRTWNSASVVAEGRATVASFLRELR